MLRQRLPRKTDTQHLKFVRAQPCCVCRSLRNVEAAHIRMPCLARGKPPTGMQQKPDDKWTVPLCAYHHRIGIDSQHANNERDWWKMRGIDPFAIALKLWSESGAEARDVPALNAKKPRRKPAKRRPEFKATIPGRRFDGTPIPSRRVFS